MLRLFKNTKEPSYFALVVSSTEAPKPLVYISSFPVLTS